MKRKVEVQKNMIFASHRGLTRSSLIAQSNTMQEKSIPLRVCMLAYAFYESDTRILQYATALAERGDIVDVIALRRDDLLPKFEVINGVNVYRIQSRTVDEKGLFTYISRIGRFLLQSSLFLHRKNTERSYDIVHVHNVPDFLVFASISVKLKKIPIILDIHDLLPEFYASKFKISHSSFVFKLLTFVERWSASFASHIIIANDLWRDRLVARSSQIEKCSVVRNRPDLEIFVAHADKKEKNNKFLLMYPGSLNWHQGLDIAIRAFASISDQIPDAEFHIYGEGSAKASLVLLANELGMQQRVIFHGLLPSREIARVMATADLAIEPKRAASAFGNEALSTKILEFMSLGVPVIACRTKIHAYYYDDSVIQYYENDSEAELADQILRLKNGPDLCSYFVANAKKYVQENSWNARKGDYLKLVDTLVSSNLQFPPTLSNVIPIVPKSSSIETSQNNGEINTTSKAAGDKENAPRYVLITAAYNEEPMISRTIDSVISQTIVPIRWVIVSDGSTDGTDEIIQSYCARYDFIQYLRLDQGNNRGVVSKVNALNLAYESLNHLKYDFLGNLDADVSFDQKYVETLLQKFQLSPTLGIAGGLVYEKYKEEFKCRISNSVTSVAHAAQLLRRKCYEDIGGYVALKYGGEDWYAEVNARMLGWRVEAFPDLMVKHHRPTGAADWVLRHRFREGRMDFSVGSHPVFEFLKCARRIPESPIVVGSFTRLAGFACSYLAKSERLVSAEFVTYLRKYQKSKINSLLGRLNTVIVSSIGSSQ